MNDNPSLSFTLPPNPPKDIVISNGIFQEIRIKNHFSAAIIWGPILLAISIPGLYFMFTSDSDTNFDSILLIILSIIMLIGGVLCLFVEIRNQLIDVVMTVNDEMLVIKFSNTDQPIEIQRGLDLVLLVDGIEMFKGAPPTHRIIARLAYEGEVFVNFGSLTKKQYLWLKELFKSYFTLNIVYEDKTLEEMQL